MIVVTGATGNVGGHLVQALAEAGAEVVAVSRGTRDAPPRAGVRHHRADLTDPGTLSPAFRNARALFLHDTGGSAHLLDPHTLLEAAREGGIGRVVLLSSQGVVTRPQSASHGGVGRSFEDAVRDSGIAWTMLRPGGFASNAMAWAESIRAQRTAAAPFGDIGLPVVDPSDIAGVAAAALLEDGHSGQIYELTGPALSTPRQRAQEIGTALGEPIRFLEQTPQEARAQMSRFMPEPVVETTLQILGSPTEAEQRISPDVEKVLGRAPRSFADWALRNADAFR